MPLQTQALRDPAGTPTITEHDSGCNQNRQTPGKQVPQPFQAPGTKLVFKQGGLWQPLPCLWN